jgi:DNA gyrase subunit A
MTDFAKEVLPVNIEEEMRQSYLDYAMSVIVGRALPDARDGLKPVHRRVLYAMHELGNDWNKAYKKSARIVGDVIGKYHPHGDTAVYDTIVRMAQPFSLRYMLVDGQGNFGSVDGDSAAAMRYTEIRMSKMAHDLLEDLDKETVNFTPNYDESEHEPSILPTRLPNLLINGSEGIAVGMATKIPPHNLTEVVSATIALIDDPEIDVPGLMEYVPGPDFPTAAIINGVKGIHEAYRTGRGKIYLRARTHVEGEDGKKQTLVVDELPYQVNKAKLLERIGELVRDKKLTGISALRDESDKDGMRMVIEIKRGKVVDVVRNNLFKQTTMQNVFGINMVALVDGQPKLINLKQALEVFVRHRREVVTRRTLYELRKARERAHVLEGLAIALTNIDPIIAMIKASATPAEAKVKLAAQGWEPGIVVDMLSSANSDDTRPESLEDGFGLVDGLYHLSPVQVQAILDLKLHRLTGLEKEKILDEYRVLLEKIAELLNILRNPDRLMEVIREELVEMREKYGDERKTEIVQNQEELSLEDLINEEDVVVTLSHGGYVKAQPIADYRAQKRGGRGKSAAATKDEDFIERLIVASTHDTVLCFSTRGRLYWLKVYQLPQAGRTARGKPINNLLSLEDGERITAFLSVREYAEDKYIFMATKRGIVKKTPLTAFSRQRSAGLIAVELRDDDELVGVEVTDGESDIMLFASGGKAVRFTESVVRSMGRTARGVKGMKLDAGETIISLIVPDKSHILTATKNGYGKRTPLEEYPCKGRGTKGVISVQTSERNGEVIGAVQVDDSEEIMMISSGGILVRTKVAEVGSQGRNTQGVRLIRLDKGTELVGLERVEESEEIADDSDDDSSNDAEN